MISGGSMAQGRSSPSLAVEWSSLPDELLAIVFSKIFSPRGRVRFAAVCSSWRAAASRHPAPPALPLLLLSTSNRGTEKRRLYCPEDDDILSVPLPSALHEQKTWLSGSYDGGWIVAGGMNKIAIVNLFSGIEVALSKKQSNVKCTRHPRGPTFVWKIIFSEAPTSQGCILAGMTDVCNIALCRVGCPEGGWTMEGCEREELGDIAFCNGLTKCSEKLFRYNIGENEDGAPVVTAACLLNVKRRDGPICKSKYFTDYVSYIFEFCGKLAMAVRIPWSRNRENFFKVFELVPANANNDAHDYNWVELHSLGDYALFLGSAFSSRVVHVPVGGRGGVKRNHIYYSHYLSLSTKHDKGFDGKVYPTGSAHGGQMYYREDRNARDGGDDVEQITTVVYYAIGEPCVPTWCFPPDF